MPPEGTRKIRTEKLPPGQFRHSFDHLPGTLLFAKEREGHLMAGNPAQDYMIRMRVIEVRDLLVRTNQAVTTVALEVGFQDHSDFARQFRRQMGQTASQYRLERRSVILIQAPRGR